MCKPPYIVIVLLQSYSCHNLGQDFGSELSCFTGPGVQARPGHFPAHFEVII